MCWKTSPTSCFYRWNIRKLLGKNWDIWIYVRSHLSPSVPNRPHTLPLKCFLLRFDIFNARGGSGIYIIFFGETGDFLCIPAFSDVYIVFRVVLRSKIREGKLECKWKDIGICSFWLGFSHHWINNPYFLRTGRNNYVFDTNALCFKH